MVRTANNLPYFQPDLTQAFIVLIPWNITAEEEYWEYGLPSILDDDNEAVELTVQIDDDAEFFIFDEG